MIVVVTAEAERDLEDIAAYVAQQSLPSALTLIRGLREKCDSLADAPRSYPPALRT
ncbi:type II toxin-antitoxin system RelE/ParE family toxin [Bradyrhizobium amphicarpaeae]|uniref:type II toxin-antitoxin system RelE/ParE family toxin n=1 Tax=Bradyrhizobium amphicarpaeae TaxID=1404768 RepID=UPI002FE63EA7